MLDAVEIPYRGYWSTPFARWQMSFAGLHSLQFAAHVAQRELARRDIPAASIDHAVLGMTVPQDKSFWGVPWLMSQIGAPDVAGPTIAQACATGTKCLALAAGEVAAGAGVVSLVVAADRVSNGPVLLYPQPGASGGAPKTENWVLDNFAEDPNARIGPIGTAENVARDWQISTSEQHDLVLCRAAQYAHAKAGNAAFQQRYMTLPFDVPDARFAKMVGALDGDEGIHPTSSEGLAKLKPVTPGGSVTYGAQTHPADGNAAMILAAKDRARELSADPKIRIRLRGFGQARERVGYMPAAPIKAARKALDQAGRKIADLAAIKSHNPFAVNDIVFARETGAKLAAMNNYGCSLIYGHPQGPTALRGIIELIEELVLLGGGHGLFQGCAAGDTAMAVVISVDDRGS
jgi:acetyl-CoA acetyltransferase